jgi:nitrogenase molybdenum-iron protein alpha/beta subunit
MDKKVLFRGSLSELLRKVDSLQLSHELPLSHETPCKFWTAYWTICGIEGSIPLIHGPAGCARSAKELRHFNAEYCGCPYEITASTDINEEMVIFGAEMPLRDAILELETQFHPSLICVLTTCSSGIIGDDVDAVVDNVRERTKSEILVIKCEGFSGDFRSGYDEAYEALLSLVKPSGVVQKNLANIVGARRGPEPLASPGELIGLLDIYEGLDLNINAIISQRCTIPQLRKAGDVQVNLSWCTDLGVRLGEMMENRFGTPFAKYGMPYGLTSSIIATQEIGELIGEEKKAQAFIKKRVAAVSPYVQELREQLEGKTAIISMGPIRAIHLSRFLSDDLGMNVVIHNVHPYQIKERKKVIQLMLDYGINPQIVITQSAYTFGEMKSMLSEEEDLREIVRDEPRDVVYFGSAYQFPGVPLVNIDNQESFPHIGFIGIKRMYKYIKSALKTFRRPRSQLYWRVLH